MSEDKQKAKGFIGKLTGSPAVINLAPAHKEDQILQFLNANSRMLYATLSGPSYFPGRSWDDIRLILHEELSELTALEIENQSNEFLGSFPVLFDAKGPEDARPLSQGQRQEITEYAAIAFRDLRARVLFMGEYAAFAFRAADRYVDAIFSERSYCFFELTKVQKLKLTAEQLKQVINLSFILRPTLFFSFLRTSDNMIASTSSITAQTAERMKTSLTEKYPYINELQALTAAYSALSFQHAPLLEASARLCAIFSVRGRTIKPEHAIDRGAESPDKSWFLTAKKNAAYLGFDRKMLEELYRIASERNW